MKTRTAQIKTKYVDSVVDIIEDKYANGGIALRLVNHNTREPMMIATVCLPDRECADDEVFIKDYSENDGITAELQRLGIISNKEVGAAVSGFVLLLKYKYLGLDSKGE